MYLEFYGLNEYPFQLTPDSDFLYLSESHARARAYMDYSIWNRDGFVAITGDVGTGKTTLIQSLLSELDENVLVAKIFQTQLNEVEFLQAVLNEFNIKAFNAGKVELLDLLNSFFIDQFMQSKQLVLIIDEAQNLSYRVLEELRMLSGLETQKEKMLHVILVGQPELREKLESPELSQLLQRIRLRFHVEPLSKKDVESYVLHRMQVAGAGNQDLFERDTFGLIHQYTGGVPRLINTLCDTALTFAFTDEKKTVSAKTIRQAVKELKWPQFRKRTKRNDTSSVKPTEAQEEIGEKNSRRREIDVLSHDLARVDALLPSLLGIAERMVHIEGKLQRIADRMEGNVEKTEDAELEKKPRSAGK